jgi:hypothetical protein
VLMLMMLRHESNLRADQVQFGPYHTKVITATANEAPHVLDGLYSGFEQGPLIGAHNFRHMSRCT